jgi:excisionase family DNA binding protein
VYISFIDGTEDAVARTPEGIIRPHPKSQAGARAALDFLVKEKGARYEVRELLVKRKTGGPQLVDLPPEAARLLVRILTEFANGNAVTVVPVNAELTTQEAAEFLNVSRPYFVSVLEAGKLPFRKVGARRRVRLADLLRFKGIEDAGQKKALDELAAEAQKLGLGC